MIVDRNKLDKYLPITGGFISAVLLSLALLVPVTATVISVRADGKPMLARLVVAIFGQVAFFWLAHEIFPWLRAYCSRNIIGYSLRLDYFRQWTIENRWRAWRSDPNFQQNWVPLTEVSERLYAECMAMKVELDECKAWRADLETKVEKLSDEVANAALDAFNRKKEMEATESKLLQRNVEVTDLKVTIENAIARIELVSQCQRGKLAEEIRQSLVTGLAKISTKNPWD